MWNIGFGSEGKNVFTSNLTNYFIRKLKQIMELIDCNFALISLNIFIRALIAVTSKQDNSDIEARNIEMLRILY